MFPLGRTPPMNTTAHRDLALLRRYHRHGDHEARTALVESTMPLVRSIAGRYAGRGEQLEDLVQVGTVGLLKAIDRFDVESSHRFVSFAVPNISGEIKRHFRDHSWAAHVPRSVQELDLKVRRARDELAATRTRAGRSPSGEPTTAEIARHLGEPLSDVEQAIQAGRCRQSVSIDVGDRDDSSPLDRAGGLDRRYEQVEARRLLQQCSPVLDARERRVVWMRYYADMLQREIAEEIGVSQMQVSRVLTRAVDRMRWAAERDARSSPPPSMAA